MNIKLRRASIFCLLSTMFIIFPVFFSSIFAIVDLKIPSYALISGFGIFLSLIAFSSLKNPDNVAYSLSLRNLILLLLIVWFYISVTYTPSQIYARDKIIALTYNTVIPIFILFISFAFSKVSSLDYKKAYIILHRSSIVLLVICAVVLILLGHSGTDGRTVLPGVENPIWVSRFFGTILLVLICQNSRSLFIPKNILLILLCTGCIFISGSRTPLIGVMLVFIIFLVYERGMFAVLKFALPLVFTFLISYIVFSDSYIFETNFYSLYHRFDILKTTLNLLSEIPIFGYGLGSFGVLILNEDVAFYPHNIFVELLFETGYLGLSLFLFILFLFYKNFSGNIFEYLVVYYLILSMTSGDFAGNNVLFILLFLSGLFYKGYRNYCNEKRAFSFT